MNSVEFKEVQDKLADLVIRYDNFLKVGFMLDLQYNLQFADLLDENYRLVKENELMQTVLLMVTSGKPTVEIDSYILTYKAIYEKDVKVMHDKRIMASTVFKRLKEITTEQYDAFVEKYEDYIRNYHPSLKINATEQDVSVYNQIKNFFFSTNITPFYATLDLLTEAQKVNVSEKDYNRANVYYNKIMMDIINDINNKKDKYPYNMKEIFDTEMNTLSEEAELRFKANTLKKGNVALHKDYRRAMRKDIKL